MGTKIEWAEEVWNLITGCTPISEGCQHCYAQRMATRLKGRAGYPEDEPFRVTLHMDRFIEPYRWKSPRRIFVNSMGDTFHPEVEFESIRYLWTVAANCPQHTFLFLTKRPKRMLEFTQWMAGADHISTAEWPRNCWLGVTAENQARANERIPTLLRIPAAVRFVSVEPMLGPVDLGLATPCDRNCNEFQNAECPGTTGLCMGEHRLDWVIAGCESGPKRRPSEMDWFRRLRDACQAAGAPYFLKQADLGSGLVKMPELDGRVYAEFPVVRSTK